MKKGRGKRGKRKPKATIKLKNSASCLKNYGSRSTAQIKGQASSSKPKHAVRHDPLGEEATKRRNTGRYAVRITSRRIRLCDPDNLCGKYFLDALRYAGILPEDTPEFLDYSITQEKVKRKEDQKTIIDIRWRG